MENRVLSLACLLILAVLVVFAILNFAMHLWNRLLILFFVFVTECVVYYFSRVKQKFRPALIVNAVISYIALGINYMVDAGINGPTIFLFFFTLHILISTTPNRLHGYWLFIHIAVVTLLMCGELKWPLLIKFNYTSNGTRV